MNSKKGFLLKAATYAPILTALSALSAVIYGICNVDRQLELQSEIKAIDLYKDYTLRIEQNQSLVDTAFTFNAKNWNTNYILFAHYTLFISESIYSLRKGDEAWENTLMKYVLFPHIPFYDHNVSVDDALKKDFRIFYNKAVKYFYTETGKKPSPSIGEIVEE